MNGSARWMTVDTRIPSERHHFLPVFYQRPWTDAADGKLWQYKVVRQQVIDERRVTPKQTGFERHLYSVERESEFYDAPREDQIETDVFGPIDNDAAVVHRIILAEGVEALTEDDRHAWAVFLSSLLERHPSKILERDRWIEESHRGRVEDFLNRAPSPESRARMKEVLDSPYTIGLERNALRTFMVREIMNSETLDAIKSLRWQHVRIDRDYFWTSDAPLLPNLGQREYPITWMTLSLSPRDILMIHPSHWAMDEEFKNVACLMHCLELVPRSKYIYARSKVETHELVDLRTALDVALEEVTWPTRVWPGPTR